MLDKFIEAFALIKKIEVWRIDDPDCPEFIKDNCRDPNLAWIFFKLRCGPVIGISGFDITDPNYVENQLMPPINAILTHKDHVPVEHGHPESRCWVKMNLDGNK